MVASGAITSTLGVITSLSCIAVLLASPMGGALLVCARARYLSAPCPLGSTRRHDSTTPQGYLTSRETVLLEAASDVEIVAQGLPLAWEGLSASFIPY